MKKELIKKRANEIFDLIEETFTDFNAEFGYSNAENFIVSIKRSIDGNNYFSGDKAEEVFNSLIK